MSFEISGRIAEIFPTQQITDTFKKREFILETKETGANGMDFIEYIKFQTLQDKCAMLDDLTENEMVTVSFNLKGRKWEKDGKVSYFTNLDAWKIDRAAGSSESASGASGQAGDIPPPPPPPDDLSPEGPSPNDSGFDDLPF